MGWRRQKNYIISLYARARRFQWISAVRRVTRRGLPLFRSGIVDPLFNPSPGLAPPSIQTKRPGRTFRFGESVSGRIVIYRPARRDNLHRRHASPLPSLLFSILFLTCRPRARAICPPFLSVIDRKSRRARRRPLKRALSDRRGRRGGWREGRRGKNAVENRARREQNAAG